MRVLFLNTILMIAACVVFNFAEAQSADSGSFYLHKFAQNIGKETYRVTRKGNSLTYDISFRFNDRGREVPLETKLVTTAKGEPLSLFIKGSTSRFSTINDTVRIDKNMAFLIVDDSSWHERRKPLAFPVGGYSPGTVQMLLLKFWNTHGRPKSIPLLPKGEVAISLQGTDTLSMGGKPTRLNRYVLKGLVWGYEIIWTDGNGSLVCLITNDAEGDKLEMTDTHYESLLSEFISRGASCAMQLFRESAGSEPTKSKLTAIVGASVIDVEEGKLLPDQVVLIENGLIKAIGDKSAIKIPAGATTIMANGKYLVPGLWDMHAHFQQAEWGPAYLAAGVTTVRDCGNEFVYINAIKEAIDKGKGVGPSIIKAGIVDGPGEKGLGIVRAFTRDEAIRIVNLYKENGFSQIKVYSSIKPDILKVIAGEAHRLGLTVTGHVPMEMTTKAAIDSGMDQLNHIQYVYAMMKRREDRSVDLDDSTSKAALDYLAAHHTVVDATVGVFEMSLRSIKDDLLEWEPNFYRLPLPLQVLFANTGMPPDQAEKFRPVFLSLLSLVKALHEKGITVVAGTDMGFPGWSLHRELELYVRSGLSPLDALRSATIVPARVMKMDQQTGSLKAGKQADLLMVDENPLQSISNIRTVRSVFKNGVQYDPNKLHRMADFKE